jgi:hypothetical protein
MSTPRPVPASVQPDLETEDSQDHESQVMHGALRSNGAMVGP